MIPKRWQKPDLNTTASAEKPTVLLTFDVEDWFQVENLKSVVSRDSWSHREQRVFRNTVRIMDLLDGEAFHPRATFFVLGWIARRLPQLVRKIASRGHEVASHGDGHVMMNQMPSDALLADLSGSKALLEDITGHAVTGYRAPSFSISPKGLDLIRRAGYRYDSSYNSFGSHGRYGSIDLSGAPGRRGVHEISPGFFRSAAVQPASGVPVSGLRVLPPGRRRVFSPLSTGSVPAGHGKGFKTGERAFTFYAHPWEFDPDQPRVAGIPMPLKFRHYVNLDKTASRLTAMIRQFSSCRFSTIRNHLKAL